MRKIFICYRREDTEHAAGALARDLRFRYGTDAVFRDKESIDGGKSWREEVLDEIDHQSVLLVLLGKGWVDCRDSHGRRRLDQSDDPVRVELHDALRDRATVIPVRVESVPMPRADQLPTEMQPFAELNALELRDGDWSHDLDRLFATLESAGFTPVVQPAQRMMSFSFIACCAALALSCIGIAYLALLPESWNATGREALILVAFVALVSGIFAYRDHRRRGVQRSWVSTTCAWSGLVAFLCASALDAPAILGDWYDESGGRWKLTLENDKYELRNVDAVNQAPWRGSLMENGVLHFEVVYHDNTALGMHLTLDESKQILAGNLPRAGGAATRIRLSREPAHP